MADSNRALRALAPKPSLEQLKKQARELLKQVRLSAIEALQRVRASHPRHAGKARVEAVKFALSDAQLVIAREYGFESWPKLKSHVERILASSPVQVPASATRALMLWPLQDAVLLPDVRMVLEVGGSPWLAALQAAAREGAELVCVAQRSTARERPLLPDLHEVGTLARVEFGKPALNGRVTATFRGGGRARLKACVDAGDHLGAQVETLAAPALTDAESLACVLRLHAALERLARVWGRLSLPELSRMAQEQRLGELIGAGAACCELPLRQRWLEQDDPTVLVAELCEALDGLAVRTAQPALSTNPAADARSGTACDAQLVVLFSQGYPHLRGRRYPLFAAWACTIGRAEGADVALHSDAVSRRHARVERRDDGCFVLVDTDSTNGTFVAGQANAVQCHVLQDGDRLVVGDCILCFLQGPQLEAKYQAALDRMSEEDALTLLPNRRAFRTRLDRAVLHARGHGEALSLLIAGIDGLHQHNTALGHLAGNGVLLRVAEVLRAELSDAAFLGRYAGDQFAAALPRMTHGAATVTAERLRAALAGQPVSVAGELVQVTVSVGSATLADTTDTDELIDDALAALSRAKQSGRNTVRGHAALGS